MNAPCPAAAQIRHKASLRRANLVNVTITPNDGRGPEGFTLSVDELRRFAWAILADYAPDEAAAAAAESGVSLAEATAAPKVHYRRLARGGRPTTPLPADLAMILEEIRRVGPIAQAALEHLPITRPSGLQGAIKRLADRGLIERINPGRQGTPAIWQATTPGQATARDSERIAA